MASAMPTVISGDAREPGSSSRRNATGAYRNAAKNTPIECSDQVVTRRNHKTNRGEY